jgi:ribosomal-protein-serine acetyltransferase
MTKPLFNFPMPILTQRLLIRPPQLGDEKALNAAIVESHDNLKVFMAWAKTCPSLEDSAEQVRLSVENWVHKKEQEPWLPLYIFDRQSSEFIGATGFHNYHWEIPSVETGYWIRNSKRGLGLITEAINALTRYAFEVLGVKRIAITCDADNLQSKKIPENLGYQLEGLLKFHRRKPLTNELSDTLIYAKYDTQCLPSLHIQFG